MKRMACSIASALGIAAVLVGCGDASGRPHAGVQSSSSTSKPSKMKAPAVPNPIDVEQYRLKPCGLISKHAPQSLGLTRSKVMSSPAGNKKTNACTWRSASDEDTDSLTVNLQGSGLRTPYGNQRLIHQYDVFKPTTVSGYPAVYVNDADQQKSGVNVLILGVNNHESVHIDVDTEPESPSRAKAIVDNTASAIVHKMQSGGK